MHSIKEQIPFQPFVRGAPRADELMGQKRLPMVAEVTIEMKVSIKGGETKTKHTHATKGQMGWKGKEEQEENN